MYMLMDLHLRTLIHTNIYKYIYVYIYTYVYFLYSIQIYRHVEGILGAAQALLPGAAPEDALRGPWAPAGASGILSSRAPAAPL